LAQFRDGWDSHRGRALSPTARASTVRAIGWLKFEPLPEPNVVLGSAGNVALEWRADHKELEIDIGDAGRVEFVKVDSHGNIEEGFTDRNSPDALRQLVHWLIFDWGEPSPV